MGIVSTWRRRLSCPHALVEAVVEVEVLEVLELGARGREQLLDLPDVAVHRAADVEEEQHLHAVLARRTIFRSR